MEHSLLSSGKQQELFSDQCLSLLISSGRVSMKQAGEHSTE